MIVITVELSYNNCSLCDTLAITLYILLYQLLSKTYIRTSTSDITTLPVVTSNVILQEAGYFEKSTTSLSLRAQELYFFQVAT